MSEGKSGGLAKGAMIGVAALGMFFAKFGDNIFRAGRGAARQADNISGVGRHLDDVPVSSALRGSDEFGAAADSARRSGADATIVKQGDEGGSLAGDAAEVGLDAAGVAADVALDDDSDE